MANSGRFVWYELATANVGTAKAFYSDVVGWGTGEVSVPDSTYTLFTARGTPVAGLAKLLEGAGQSGVRPQWIGYVEVGDVDAAAKRVKKLGGTVYVPPTDIPNVSRFSLIADPQGATIALIKGREKSQEQPAQPNVPGHAVWRELLASDWVKSFTFYSQLLGWQKAGSYPGLTGTYQEFSAGTEPVGGMFNNPDMRGFSLWLYYFSVRDIGEAAQTRGGRWRPNPLWPRCGARQRSHRSVYGPAGRRLRSDGQACSRCRWLLLIPRPCWEAAIKIATFNGALARRGDT